MRKPFLILIIFVFECSHVPASENYRTGARSLALSNATLTLSDSWSTFHNQATLANLHSLSAGVFYESRFLVDELSLAAGTFVLPINAGTFGLSFYQFGKGTYKAHKIGISFAKKLSDRLNAGVQLDYFTQELPENDEIYSFTTFECGFTYQATDELTLGAHVFNPVMNGIDVPELEQKMPAIIQIGGHYQFSELVLLCLETEKNTDQELIVKTGLEFSPVPNMALRLGVSGKPVQYSAGIGYTLKNISTDLAFNYHQKLGITPSVSVQIKL